MTETTKRRGRPSSGTALTPAERMAKTRRKALVAIDDPHHDLTAVSDTGLFEALRVSYRRGDVRGMASATEEMYRRANIRAKSSVIETVAVNADLVTETVAVNADSVTETVAVNADSVIETVAEMNGATITDIPSRSYPLHIRSLAIAMADAGSTNAEIRGAIRSRLGRAPDASNLPRLIRSWCLTAES